MNDTTGVQAADTNKLLSKLLKSSPAKRQALFREHDDGFGLLELCKAELDESLHSDNKRSMQLAELAFDLATFLHEERALALGNWCLALGLTVQADFQDALPYFEKARSLYTQLEDDVKVFQVSIRELQARATLGDWETALQLAQTAYEGLNAHGLKLEAANVANNLGIIQTRLGQHTDAINTLLAARQIHLELDNKVGVAYADINLGKSYQEIDQFEAALEHSLSAVKLFEELEHTYVLAGALTDLATLYRREGRLDTVLDTLARAKTLFTGLDHHKDVALVQLEEAQVRLELNMLDEAETLSRNLIDIFRNRDMEREQLEALTLLGMTLSKSGNYDEAAQTLRTARQGWHKLGNTLQAAWTDVYLAHLLLETFLQTSAEAPLHEAEAFAEQAHFVFEASGSRAGQTISLLLRAHIKLLMSYHEAAESLLSRAETLAAALNIPDFSIRTNRLLGQLAIKKSNPALAETYYRNAVKELETVRASLSINEFKAAYFGENLDVYTDLITLLVNEERYDAAFHFVERSKSRALLDLLGQNLNLEEAPSPEVLALQKDLELTREDLNKHYLKAEKEGREGKSWQKVQEAEAKVTSLLRDIERLAPDKPLQIMPPKLETICESLDAQTVVLEYVALGDTLVAFLIDDKGISCIKNLAKLSELKAHLDRFTFTLMRVAQGEAYEQVYGKDMLLMRTNGALRSLYDSLIAPLGLDLTDKQVIIIPSGILHSVPFSALFDGESYLFEKTLISLAPSTAVFLHCRQQQTSATETLVAFGVPFEDIPSVKIEVDAVAKSFAQAKTLIGEKATLKQFRHHAPNADVIHIATHGIYRPDNPMFSGLRFYDGWLAARDLYTLKLNASLVVLSACETGLSSAHSSDELFGLARGFFHAGTPCLVVSLWAVKDSPTSELMMAFYEGLKKGLSVARALQEAQRTLKESYANPYYWSAFNLLGDPGRTVSTKPDK